MSQDHQQEPPSQSNRWSLTNPFDTGIKMLKDRRDKITNGGKYSERYKDTFSHDAKDEKYPLSAKCRETLEQYRTLSKNSDKSDSSSLSSRHSPNLTTEMMGTPKAMPSNATNDLNKQENALIGYKYVPDRTSKLPIASPLTTPKHFKWPKKSKDVNIYSITPPSENAAAGSSAMTPPNYHPQKVALNLILNEPKSNDNTMSHLENVQSIISKLKEKEKQEDNLRKFDELVKKVIRNDPATTPPGKDQPPAKKPPPIDQSQDILRPQKALLNPMKPSKEIEDLQAKGFSDIENDDNDETQFKRHVKERKSMDHQSTTKERGREQAKGPSLNRTTSDVQDKNVLTLKRKPKLSRDRNKVLSF